MSVLNYWKYFLRQQVVLTLLVQPAVFGLLVGRLAVVGHADPARIAVLAIGAGVFSMWTMTAGGSVIGIFLERQTERLPLVVSSPTSVWALTTGTIIGAVVASIPALIVSWIAVWAAGTEPRIPNIIGLIIGLLAVMISLTATGVLLAPLFTVSDSALMYFNALLYPVVLLSGFINDPSSLPRPLHYLSYCLAPYWGFQFMRNALGESSDRIVYLLGGLAGTTLAYLIAFYFLASFLERRMRRSGAWLV